jgi:hypothetical protein
MSLQAIHLAQLLSALSCADKLNGANAKRRGGYQVFPQVIDKDRFSRVESMLP